MKNLILLLTLMMLAFLTIAQQQVKGLLPFAQNIIHHSGVTNDAIHEQQHQIFSSDELFPAFASYQIDELVIRKDSIIIQTKSNTLKQKYLMDGSGNLASGLTQIFYNGSWVYHGLSTYTYDENGNMLTELMQLWQGEEWANDGKHTSTYDANGNQLTFLYQYWEDGEFVNVWMNSYTYDNNGNQLTTSWQSWEDGIWINYNLITNTYNTLNKLETSLFSNWENGAWVDNRMYFYTYDTSGNLLSTQSMFWIFTEWINQRRYTFIIDNNGNAIEQLWQDWDNQNGAWVNNSLATYTFDDDGRWLTETSQLWIEETWENAFYCSRTFDSDNNLLEETRQGWANDEWGNNKKATYDFLPGHIIANAFDWDGSNWIASVAGAPLTIFMGGEWLFSESGITLDFFYTDVTGIEENKSTVETEIIHTYPNPVSNKINIDINPAWQTESCLIELFNQSGQRVKYLKLSSNSKSASASINVEDVPPGLYLLKFTTGKSSSIQKVIISR